jgi:hypothetical protein
LIRKIISFSSSSELKVKFDPEMNRKRCGIFFVAFALSAVRAQPKCPLAFKEPDQCFSLDEIKEYGPTSTSIESLYNHYVNLLTDARLTIDGDEVNFSEN